MAFFDVSLIWYVRAIEVISLFIAFFLIELAYHSYKRTANMTFLLAAVGFSLLGGASLLEGILFEVVGVNLDYAHAVRSTLTAIGLAVLLYSVHKT